MCSKVDDPGIEGSEEMAKGDINNDDTGTSGSRRNPETAIRANDSNLEECQLRINSNIKEKLT